jgi:hypothetical protein
LRPITRCAPNPAVGQEHGSVLHLGAQAALTDHVVGLCARQAHPPGQDLGRDAHPLIVGVRSISLERASAHRRQS